MGIGNLMQQATSGAMASQQQQQQDSQQTPAASSMPAVMTPAEAAQILRVSEEDVIAAIQAGDLKAKKLGNAWRISKQALEDFLNS
jgi:excisionase family DNA binding protein